MWKPTKRLSEPDLRRLLRHIPWFGWWLLTWFLSILPAAELPRFSMWNADKLLHFLFYFMQFVFAVWALGSPRGYKPKGFLLFFTANGLLIEWIQGNCISGRYADPYDALANTLGLFAAFILLRTWRT